jgi:hypothetical protein
VTESQGSLFGAGEIQFSPASAIYAFDPFHRTNGTRVADLARLGFLPEPVLDPTFGLGQMWTRHTPDVLVAGDIDADRARDVQFDFTAMPFADKAFGSTLFDPPYKLGNADEWESTDSGHDDVRSRYGVAATRRDDVWAMIHAGLTECFRVTRRIVIVKCQDQIHNGYEWQTGEIVMMARAAGWDVKDMLHVNTTIPQPPGTAQRHSRRNYSTFVVLKPAARAARTRS